MKPSWSDDRVDRRNDSVDRLEQRLNALDERFFAFQMTVIKVIWGLACVLILAVSLVAVSL